MRIYFLKFLVFYIMLVSGCAGPSYIDSNDKNNFGKIGVVNILENALEGKRLFRFGVGNNHFILEDEGFNFPKYFEEVLSEELLSKGYTAVPVKAIGPKLEHVSEIQKSFSFSGAYGADKTTPYVKEDLLELAEKQNLDTIILLTPGYSGKACAAGPYCSNTGSTGFGIFKDEINSNFYAYYSAYIFIISVPEYKIILDGWSHARKDLLGLSWPVTYKDISWEQQRIVKAAINESISDMLPVYLNEVGL